MKLVIMQGPPGSGKSTLAKEIADACEGPVVICSTDDFFMVKGKYEFNPKLLGRNHALNLEKAKKAMDDGFVTIIDNTNIKVEHVKAYVRHAVRLGIPVEFHRATGNFANVHGVPHSVVDRMRKEMQDLSIESCV